MFIVTTWTKTVTKTQIFASAIITMINVLIWYYVLQTIVNDIQNTNLVLLYAAGCALGTMISMIVFKAHEKIQN